MQQDKIELEQQKLKMELQYENLSKRFMTYKNEIEREF